MKKNLYGIFVLIFLCSSLAFAYDNDQEISNDISAAVARAGIPKPYTLKVEVEDGKVVLKGQVVSQMTKTKIGQIAEDTKDVKEVSNDMIVTGRVVDTNGGDPSTLCLDAKERLASIEGVQEFRASLDCKNADITVTGTASRDNDIIRIGQELRKVPGVRNVINQLRLPPEMSDTYLEQEIRHELVNKNGINLDGVSFEVRDGIATYSGHVRTHEEIDRILAQTLMVRGIKDAKSNVHIGGQP